MLLNYLKLILQNTSYKQNKNKKLSRYSLFQYQRQQLAYLYDPIIEGVKTYLKPFMAAKRLYLCI